MDPLRWLMFYCVLNQLKISSQSKAKCYVVYLIVKLTYKEYKIWTDIEKLSNVFV